MTLFISHEVLLPQKTFPLSEIWLNKPFFWSMDDEGQRLDQISYQFRGKTMDMRDQDLMYCMI